MLEHHRVVDIMADPPALGSASHAEVTVLIDITSSTEKVHSLVHDSTMSGRELRPK